MVRKYFRIIITLVVLIISQQSFGKYQVEPDSLECFIQNKAMGLRNRYTKALVVPCKYECITGFSQYDMSPAKRNGKWGLIKSCGKVAVDFKYDLIDPNYTFIRTKMNDKWGALSLSAHPLIENKYDDISYPNTRLGYFPVKIGEKEGYADFYGNDTF